MSTKHLEIQYSIVNITRNKRKQSWPHGNEQTENKLGSKCLQAKKKKTIDTASEIKGKKLSVHLFSTESFKHRFMNIYLYSMRLEAPAFGLCVFVCREKGQP